VKSKAPRGAHFGPATLLTQEDLMSARAETLAKQFEAKAAEMTGALEKLTDADWK
jgi:hypothetical protein